jgi:DNA-binding MarR family transcriptional regulator
LLGLGENKAAMVEQHLPQHRARARSVLQSLDHVSRLLTAICYSHGLNPAQWSALRYFADARAERRTPSAFARNHRATKGTVSQTLIALSRKGLIEKITDARDARSVSVQLTDAGSAMLTKDPWRVFETVLMKCPEESVRHVTQMADLLTRTVAGGDTKGKARGH